MSKPNNLNYFYIKPTINSKSSMPQLRVKSGFSIESYQQVPDPREGKEGDFCWIRLKETEQTIFVDEQKTVFDLDRIKFGKDKQPSIPFDDKGRKIVANSEKNLLSYLKCCRENMKNSDLADHSGTQIYEYNESEVTKKKSTAFTQDTQLRLKIQKLKGAEARTIYRIMSGKSFVEMEDADYDMDDIRYNLHILAKGREDMFSTLTYDRYLNTKRDTYEAIDRGIVRKDLNKPNMFVWRTGAHIKTYPLGQDAMESFSQDLQDNEQETLYEIRKQLGRLEAPTEDIKKEVESTIEDKLSQFILLTKDKKEGAQLFEKKGMSTFSFIDEDDVEHKLGNGYTAVKETLRNNQDLLVKVANKYNELVS